jgi:ribosome biogenesis GTPase
MAVNGPSLARLGWNDTFAAAAREWPDTRPARVARVDFGRATVVGSDGTEFAQLGDQVPAVGDWVLLDGDEIVTTLPRTSSFVRGDPMEGKARKEQVVAANIDEVFIVQSLTNGPNVRRLERELVLAFESGARPVVVLNKADAVTAGEIDAALVAVAPAAAGVDVLVTSARTGAGIETLRARTSGETVALIGASGVGKSTIVNMLVGAEVQTTSDVRANDQRGRHTTTARELVLVPGGGVLVDTPGLRAVSLWEADDGFSQAFADIETLAESCRFGDCSHTVEPDCAVRTAIERGELDPARFDHYLRLDAELDELERRRKGRGGTKAPRNFSNRA